MSGFTQRVVALRLLSLLAVATLAGCGADPPAVEAVDADGSVAVSGEEKSDAPSPPAGEARPSLTEVVEELHRGIDVSVHSGAVDWGQVAAAGHRFAFVKATEGDDLEDPAFDDHWRALKQAGLLRGAYHFYVTEDDPEEQARFFIDTVHLEPGDLAPVVDVELIGHDTAAGLADRLKTWLERVEAHYGVKPIIYTTAKFWDDHFPGEFGEYPLWVAEYGVEEPRLPAGWKTWHLWQWNENMAVPGVEKGADLTRVHPAIADLSALLVPRPD